MDSYSTAIERYLAPADRTQAKLADAIKTSQAAVSRYANGERFPDAATAREIDKATDGEVPFSLWQQEMAQRVGLDAAA